MITIALLLVFAVGLGMGYLAHRPSPVLPELDPRECLCGHDHSMHQKHRGALGAGECSVGIGKERISCACQVYIPTPESAKLPEGLL